MYLSAFIKIFHPRSNAAFNLLHLNQNSPASWHFAAPFAHVRHTWRRRAAGRPILPGWVSSVAAAPVLAVCSRPYWGDFWGYPEG
jgi:hypothetical protein